MTDMTAPMTDMTAPMTDMTAPMTAPMTDRAQASCDYIDYDFKSKVAVMQGKRADYFYLALPSDISAHIRHFTSHIHRGFKSLKVIAQIGESAWESSIFPSTREPTFFLLLNKKIRTSEKLSEGDTANTSLKICME